MFFAYNNGIAATASAATVSRGRDGTAPHACHGLADREWWTNDRDARWSNDATRMMVSVRRLCR